jgi:hypothetical protein
LATAACPKCGAATGSPHRGWSLAFRITAGLRLALWALAFAYAGLVCSGYYLARFGANVRRVSMGHVWFGGGIGVTPAISDADVDALDDLAGPLDEGPWRVSKDRRELVPGDGGDFVEPSKEALHQFARLLASRGYTLSGQVSWAGATHPPQTGIVFARGGSVEWVGDRVVNAGPSWQPGAWEWDGVRHRPRELHE